MLNSPQGWMPSWRQGSTGANTVVPRVRAIVTTIGVATPTVLPPASGADCAGCAGATSKPADPPPTCTSATTATTSTTQAIVTITVRTVRTGLRYHRHKLLGGQRRRPYRRPMPRRARPIVTGGAPRCGTGTSAAGTDSSRLRDSPHRCEAARPSRSSRACARAASERTMICPTTRPTAAMRRLSQ